MTKFAATLTMLLTKLPFLDRFALAREVLFSLRAGDWAAGCRPIHPTDPSMKTLLISMCALTLLAGCATPCQKLNRLASAEKRAGWVLLFDGQTTAGWTPREKALWDVVDGAIAYRPDTGPGFLCTIQSYGDFELKVDFGVDDVANSGVFLRCPESGHIAATNAYEVNIFDPHEKWPTGSINEVAVRRGDTRSVGRWNSYDITAQGDHLVVRFNGCVVVDAHDAKHQRGPIGLQQFTGQGMIKFRNIELKPLLQ